MIILSLRKLIIKHSRNLSDKRITSVGHTSRSYLPTYLDKLFTDSRHCHSYTLFQCYCDTEAKTKMDIISKVIPFRKKQNSFSRSRAKSHDDVYRKSRFNSLLSRSTSKLVTRSNSKLVSNSTDRLPTTGGSTIGNDDKWPFKRQTKKPIAYGNRADRLEYLGSRLCNYELSDLHESYQGHRTPIHDLHPSLQGNRTSVRSNGYLNDDGLRSRGDKVSPHSSSGGLIEEGKERRRSVISPPSANLGRY